MALEISSTLLARLLNEAAGSPQIEICGLLFGSLERISGYAPCRNIAPDPATAFEIDPAQLIAAHRAARAGGPMVVGHYHSHPNGSPSPSTRDAAEAAPDGAVWLIIGGGEARFYRATQAGQYHDRFDPLPHHIVLA